MAEAKKEAGKEKTSESRKESKKVDKSKLFYEVSSGEDFATVLSLDKEGVNIRFDVENFPSFSDEEVKQLSFLNQKRYFVDFGLHKKEMRYRKTPKTKGIEVVDDPFSGRDKASRKMQVPKGTPDMHYTTKTEDEIDDALDDGYKVLSEEEAGGPATFEETTPRGNRRTVYKVKVPSNLYNQHMKHVSLESRRRVQGFSGRFKKEVISAGPGAVFLDDSHESLIRTTDGPGVIEED